MSVVKGLVKTGITICATIHSPTPYSFNLFDSLMILLRGNVAYFGDNGTPTEFRIWPLGVFPSINARPDMKTVYVYFCAGPEAVAYFEGIAGVPPLRRDGVLHNKAEWMVDLTTKVRPLLYA
jgi:hypothetical protein